MFEARISTGATEKYLGGRNTLGNNLLVLRHGKSCGKCVERHYELAHNKAGQLYKVSPPCLDDPNFKKEDLETVGELPTTSSKIILKCLYLDRIGRLDILWSVNKLARAVTKWTRACDKRLVRLLSCIHHSNDHRPYCHVGNTARQCRLGLFQDSDFAGDCADYQSISVKLCVLSEAEHSFL